MQTHDINKRQQLLWTIGNTCLLTGIIVLLYVGGIYTNAAYQRYAARGDSNVPAPIGFDPLSTEPVPFVPAVASRPATIKAVSTEHAQIAEERQTVQDMPRQRIGQVISPVPTTAPQPQLPRVSRLVIPSIAVDSKVIDVGWEMVEQDGQQVAVWQVAQYAVGQHRGSANPGDGNNIVMAGHVGGYGRVFRDLYYVQPGEPIIVYVGNQQYTYTVEARLVVDEEGVSPKQQAANAQYIAPTGREVVTLITCWPASGPNKFTQRVIVHAVPTSTTAATH